VAWVRLIEASKLTFSGRHHACATCSRVLCADACTRERFNLVLYHFDFLQEKALEATKQERGKEGKT
jgi:hypothetical protein